MTEYGRLPSPMMTVTMIITELVFSFIFFLDGDLLWTALTFGLGVIYLLDFEWTVNPNRYDETLIRFSDEVVTVVGFAIVFVMIGSLILGVA